MTKSDQSKDNLAESILVVDDEPLVCTMFKRGLERRGFRVDTAQALPEADRFLNGKDYLTILIDIKLADCDGIDVLRRSLTLQPQTPVIMITGEPSVETATKAMRRLRLPHQTGHLTGLAGSGDPGRESQTPALETCTDRGGESQLPRKSRTSGVQKSRTTSGERTALSNPL